MKNVTTDNHYVPQHLLKNFAGDDGKLWIYDAELNKYRCGNTKSAGFECKLYPPEIEKILTKIVDTPGSEAIAELLKQKKLNGEHWINFLGFVAAQMQRTPACLDRTKAMCAPTMQETAERIAKFDPEFRQKMRNSMKEKGTLSEKLTRFSVIWMLASSK